VNRAQATNYLRKAEQHLAESLEALSAKRWDTAALLAIHAALAAVDAACVASGGVRSASQTHANQPRLIHQLLPDNEAARRAAAQLEALIERKHTVEYESRRCRQEDAETSTKQAQRVVEWARNIAGGGSGGSA
jgi:HEPN domain-containing protein